MRSEELGTNKNGQICLKPSRGKLEVGEQLIKYY